VIYKNYYKGKKMKKILVFIALFIAIISPAFAGGTSESYDVISTTPKNEFKTGDSVIAAIALYNPHSFTTTITQTYEETITVTHQITASGTLKAQISASFGASYKKTDGLVASAVVPAGETWYSRIYGYYQKYEVRYKKTVKRGDSRTVTYHTRTDWKAIGYSINKPSR
jgi:hypothetical protein